ncbi:MAG: hypothetical protein K5681_09705 [Treponema sp.]|nr:hypothetical protein [Treponema sp.]
MKKVMSVALAALMALSLVGCKGGSAKGKAMDISIFTIQQRQQPPADNKMYNWIKEKFGVTFSFDILVGDKDQKIGVLIASGDLPDLVEVDSPKFQEAGCLLDIKDLVEKYAPNLRKHYDSAWKQMLEIDGGHIYSLPNWGVYDGADQGTFYNQNGFWIQKEVLKEFGYPEIKTVDQYFDLLEKYAEKYPTIEGLPTIPFSIITADWEAFNLWNPPNFLAGYPNDGNGHVYKKGDKYVYEDNFIDENAKRWFKLANGYFQRKLIDPASFTDNRDQYYAKIAQGRVLGMFIQGWQFQGTAENTLKTNNMYNRTYAPLPVVFDESIKPHYRDLTIPNLQRGYGFTTKCGEKKAIEILKFFDQLILEENQKILRWGFEGEDWQKDAQGRPYRTEEQRKQQEDNDWLLHNRAQLLFEEAPKMEGSFSDGLACDITQMPWEFQATARAEDVELWAAYDVASYAALVDKNPPANAGWYPMWQIAPVDGSEAQLALSKLESIQRKYLPKMIMESPADFDGTWETYVSEMKAAGIDKYVSFMQENLDNRVKLFGGFPDDK